MTAGPRRQVKSTATQGHSGLLKVRTAIAKKVNSPLLGKEAAAKTWRFGSPITLPGLVQEAGKI